MRLAFPVRSMPGVDSRRGRCSFLVRMQGSAAFVVAFLLTLLVGTVHLLREGTDQLPLAGDSVKYHQLAGGIEQLVRDPDLGLRLLRGGLTAEERAELWLDRWEFQHAPAYTVPLGLFRALLPGTAAPERIFSLLCYAAAGGLLVLLGRVMLGPLLTCLALLGYLLYLPLVYYSTAVATESHASLALLLTAWLLWRFHRRGSPARALLAGLALALLFLAKTTFRAPAAAILLVEIGVLLRGHRARRLVPLLLGAAGPLALWHAFLVLAAVPLDSLAASGQGSLWLYRGNYVPDQGWETCGLGDAITPELKSAGREVAMAAGRKLAAEVQQRRMYPRAFWRTLRADPLGMAALVAQKFGLFWSYPAVKTRIHSGIGTWAVPRAIHRLLLPLGLLGLSLALVRPPGLWFAALLAVGVAGVHAASHLVARYNLPVLPLWWLSGLFGLRALARLAIRFDGGAAPRRAVIRKLIWFVAGLVGLGIGGLLRHPPLSVAAPLGRALYIAGALLSGLAGFALLMLLARGLSTGQRRRQERTWALAAGPALLGLSLLGHLLSDRDWDRIAVTLREPGDAVVQRIVLPAADLSQQVSFDEAWIDMDILRSPQGSFVLEVLVDGRLLHSFTGSLGTRYEDFLFDGQVHAVQERYRRLADTYQTFVDGRLTSPDTGAALGFDYFRRWVRVAIPKPHLNTDRVVEIELRLAAAAEGAWVRVYADRYPENQAGRGFRGPALGANPYDYSSYRAEFFAGDRERMDGRLIRPTRLQSVAAESFRRRGAARSDDLGDAWGRQVGELRIRIGVQLRGVLAARRAPDGQLKPVWVTELAPGDRLMTAEEMRDYASWRDQYFNGVWFF